MYKIYNYLRTVLCVCLCVLAGVCGCLQCVYIFWFEIFATVPRDFKMLLKCQLEDEILSKVSLKSKDLCEVSDWNF